MISDLDESLGSRYFLNVANERTCSRYSFLEVKLGQSLKKNRN